MLRKLASRPDWQIAMAVAAVLRVFYTALGAAFAPSLHPDPALIHSNELTDNLPAPHTLHYSLLGIWQRFDTLWFLRIAEHGYDRPMAVIFYPAYPALIRLMSGLLPAIAAALVVSTAATFFLFWGLLRVAGQATELRKLRTLLLFCVWPSSFVLFAGYADSLTIALVVWAVVFGREERWGVATACGLIAGAARPSGVLVFIPLAVMALRSRQARSLVVALTPVGALGYWGWLRWSGHSSVVDAYRLYQGMTMVPPWTGFSEAVRLIVGQHDVLLAIKLGLVILVGVITVRGQSRSRLRTDAAPDTRNDGQNKTRAEVGIADKAFAVAVLLQMLMYTGRPLLGATRYVLMVYPAFLVWGAYAERWSYRRFGFCLAVLGVMNLAWMWAFLNWSLVL